MLGFDKICVRHISVSYQRLLSTLFWQRNLNISKKQHLHLSFYFSMIKLFVILFVINRSCFYTVVNEILSAVISISAYTIFFRN